jgi:hypothetical protein
MSITATQAHSLILDKLFRDSIDWRSILEQMDEPTYIEWSILYSITADTIQRGNKSQNLNIKAARIVLQWAERTWPND